MGGREEQDPELETMVTTSNAEDSEGGCMEAAQSKGGARGSDKGGEQKYTADTEEGGGSDEEEEERAFAGGSIEIRTKEDMRRELSNMSFEDIMKLKDKVGTKVYSQVAFGSNKKPETSSKKRLNKNRPMEISAKRPAPFLRQVVPVNKPMLRDPRFDDLSGEYKTEIFEETYKFVDEIKSREKQMIKRQLRKSKLTTQRKEKLQSLLKRMENQESVKKSREQQRERELQFKRQQREQANQGDRPFFIKKSEKKKVLLADKYQELKKSGKLENFLIKKRKRNAGKDRRKLPEKAAAGARWTT